MHKEADVTAYRWMPGTFVVVDDDGQPLYVGPKAPTCLCDTVYKANALGALERIIDANWPD